MATTPAKPSVSSWLRYPGISAGPSPVDTSATAALLREIPTSKAEALAVDLSSQDISVKRPESPTQPVEIVPGELDLVPLGLDQLWALQQFDQSKTGDEAADMGPECDATTLGPQGTHA